MKQIETDVLVVGGGSAGLRAALAARESGAKVLVVNRGSKTSGGATSFLDKLIEETGLALTHNKEEADYFYEELQAFGLHVNSSQLIRIFTEDNEKELRFLESIGVGFKREDNDYVWMNIPSHQRPRVVKGVSDFGTVILQKLTSACEENGVEFLTHTGIYDIVKDSTGNPRWALGMEKVDQTNQPVQVRFSSVVLATGGFGNLFSYSTNPLGSASGMALGLNVGAKLSNLEFMHILPLLVHPIRGFYLLSSLVSQGQIVNAAEEEFTSGWDDSLREPDTVSQGNITFRICQWIEQQQENGKAIDGGVKWYGTNLVELMQQRIPRSLELLKERGLDLTTQPAIISAGCHQALGGIAIGTDGETNIPGLFASGECAGGFQGAQRMMGTGVMDALVFGSRAGKAAAEAIGSSPISRWIEMNEDSSAFPNLTYEEGMHQLNAAMDRILVTKNEEKLLRAKREVESIQKALADFHIGTAPFINRLRYSELHHALTIAQAFIASSLAREETRGNFIRNDYPEQKERFAKPSFVHRSEQNELHVSFD